MHLVEGLKATATVGIMQATRSNCAPLMNMSLIHVDAFDRAQAEKCIEFNESVVRYVSSDASIEVVVLSSPFSPYLVETYLRITSRALVKSDRKFTEQAPNAETALAHLLQTAQRIRALGKRVVVVAPPPSAGLDDMSRCLERKATGKPTLGAEPRCAVALGDYRSNEQQRLAFLNRAERAGIDVIWLEGVLCHGQWCATEIDGTFIYRDRVHLSYDGSRLPGKRMQLTDLVWRRAS